MHISLFYQLQETDGGWNKRWDQIFSLFMIQIHFILYVLFGYFCRIFFLIPNFKCALVIYVMYISDIHALLPLSYMSVHGIFP